jgi:hypothetical protein
LLFAELSGPLQRNAEGFKLDAVILLDLLNVRTVLLAQLLDSFLLAAVQFFDLLLVIFLQLGDQVLVLASEDVVRRFLRRVISIGQSSVERVLTEPGWASAYCTLFVRRLASPVRLEVSLLSVRVLSMVVSRSKDRVLYSHVDRTVFTNLLRDSLLD